MKLFEKSMNFLGSVIRDGKIHPSPHQVLKTKEIELKDVVNIADLRKFLGMCVFLSKHLHRSTEVFKHLRKLIGKDGNEIIKWSENDGFLEREFQKAKMALDELTALTPYDRNKVAYIMVDSSKDGVGAILFQKDAVTQTNNVVEFYSRKRPDAERKYDCSSCVLETAGMVGAVNYWRHYLEDQSLVTTIFTDSKSLEAVAKRFANNQIPSDVRLINKFFSKIQGLRLKVRYVPGNSMTIKGVDLISRYKNNITCDDTCDICKLAKIPSVIPNSFVAGVSQLCTDLTRKYKFHEDIETSQQSENIAENFKKKFGWKKSGVRQFAVNELVAPVKKIDVNMTLSDLLKCHWMFRDAQAKEKHLRQARRIILANEQVPPRQMRVDTLVNKKKSFVESGILKYKRFLGADEFVVIPIPVDMVNTAIGAIHKEFGCKSVTQMNMIFNRYFECANSKSFIDLYLKKCPNCILLRKDNTRQVVPLKKIPLPENLGDQIYVDEIHRTNRDGSDLKLFFATEGLSRYGVTFWYQGALTGDMFVKFMCTARAVLSPLHTTNVKVVLRCDKASQHTSGDTKKRLKSLGFDLQLFESSTLSKNIIPEQDARIATLSKFLNVAMNNPRMTMEQSVMWAIIQYNTSLTNLNWSPAEIFTKRRLGSQLELALSNTELKNRLALCRERSRKAADKERSRKRKRKLLKFKPWENIYLNSPEMLEKIREEFELIKEGDVVKLHQAFEKIIWTVYLLSKILIGV